MGARDASLRLLIFVRDPRPGAAKTRLIPLLGAEGAAALYRRLAERTLAEARGLGAGCTVLVEPAASVARVARWLGPGPDYRPQAAGDLGRRLETACASAFASGARRVVAIGSDCPGLTRERLAGAFDALATHDAVLGPAEDGGYYLIGLARPLPRIFREVPWSNARTAAVTRERIAAAGASLFELTPLADVDTPDDLDAAAARRAWLRAALDRLLARGRDDDTGARAAPGRGS